MPSYQGTLLTIRTAVIDKLRLDATDDATKVTQWVNIAYQKVVQETGCLQKVSTATLTSGTSSYDLPAAVGWIKQLTITYSDGSVSEPLQELNLDEILERRRDNTGAGENTNQPVYALAGQSLLELWPEPGAGQSMSFWYVYLPEALAADGDSPVIMEPWGSKLLELGACVEGAKFKKDPLLQMFQADYMEERAEFQRWLNRRQTGIGRSVPVYLTGLPQLRLARDVG